MSTEITFLAETKNLIEEREKNSGKSKDATSEREFAFLKKENERLLENLEKERVKTAYQYKIIQGMNLGGKNSKEDNEKQKSKTDSERVKTDF